MSFTKLAFYIKISALIVATMLLRPGIFGQDYTSLSIPFLAIAIGFHVLGTLQIRFEGGCGRKTLAVVAGVVLLWTFFLFQLVVVNSLNQSVHDDFVIKAFFANVFAIAACAVVLSDYKANSAFFRGFVLLSALPAASYVVTLVAVQFKSPESLRYYQLAVTGYTDRNSGSILFPMSPIYSFIKVGSVNVVRFQDFFRESGIAQAMLGWSYIVAGELFKRKRMVRLLLAIGIVGTFSTMGLLMLPILFFLAKALESKWIARWKTNSGFLALGVLGALLLGVGGLAAYYVPAIGLASKIGTASGETRETSMTAGLANFSNSPLGTGLYNSASSNAAINLVAGMAEIGIIGLLLYLLTFYLAIRFDKNPLLIAVALFPIVVTSIVSQPLVDAPMLYIILLYASPSTIRERFIGK